MSNIYIYRVLPPDRENKAFYDGLRMNVLRSGMVSGAEQRSGFLLPSVNRDSDRFLFCFPDPSALKCFRCAIAPSVIRMRL